MNLIVDQGNTSVKIALFDKDGIVSVDVFELSSVEEIMLSIKKLNYCNAIYSTSSLPVNSLMATLKENSVTFVNLTYHTPLPIKVDYATPQTLGMDRVAAAVGAREVCGEVPTLVIDAGTAVTYDYLTPDGVYKGGNIAPGISMRLKALNHFTKSLPLVEVSNEYPLLGVDTNSAILSGVMSGVKYECEGYIAKISKKDTNLKVILTGGDHLLLYNQLKNSTFVPLIDDEYLVLKGLNAILRYNVEK
ncbi:MAG: type III pantothenate kinase [Bacteroidales bacterium]|nr:type III pantothenate kinase [Bacteroidales bacterium]